MGGSRYLTPSPSKVKVVPASAPPKPKQSLAGMIRNPAFGDRNESPVSQRSKQKQKEEGKTKNLL